MYGKIKKIEGNKYIVEIEGKEVEVEAPWLLKFEIQSLYFNFRKNGKVAFAINGATYSFFKSLKTEENYETPSCNEDSSIYLVPNGRELSYGAHPDGTIRLSDHWTWHSPKDNGGVQCLLYGTTPKEAKNNFSQPIKTVAVAICFNGIYYPFKIY